jgi:hypothetical protein
MHLLNEYDIISLNKVDKWYIGLTSILKLSYDTGGVSTDRWIPITLEQENKKSSRTFP